MNKICPKCKSEKDVSCFDVDKNNPSGYQSYCKQCRREQRSKPHADIPSLEGEIWKNLIGYEGIYEISNSGRIKSIDRMVLSRFGSHRVLRRGNLIVYTGKRYKLVKLSKDGECITKLVHILVAINFVDNPLNLPFVNHKDGIRFHNTSDNLEWSTQSDNQLHAYRTGLQKAKLSIEDVQKARRMKDSGMKFIEISHEIGNISAAHISRVIRGESIKRFQI